MSTQITNSVAGTDLPHVFPSTQPRPRLVERYFTESHQTSIESVFQSVEWELRDAVIKKYGTDEIVFEQRGIEVPKSWSDQALQIVAQKYFKGPLGSAKRETSVKQLISRVVFTVVKWGLEDRYFTLDQAHVYAAELAFLLVHQYGCFNSPVWFNVGTEFATDPEHPQCSACFINSVEDRLDGELGILDWLVREGRIFKDGSGSGVNLFKLRSKFEHLSSGGRPSGVVSFMRTADKNAGQIKSGGKTRRAAKMVILNVDHGDIEEFIAAKAKAEKTAHDLIGLGYSAAFDDPDGAYGLVDFQNANNSVRVDDEFMRAVVEDGTYFTRKRNPETGCAFGTGEPLQNFRARDLMRKMAEAAWFCGDPGIQYHDTINNWNPVFDTLTQWATNPCSEYSYIDDSACNLASMNLMKFVDANGVFDHKAFRHAIRVVGLAMEIFVDRAGYPTERIARNSYDYRPLGLGYANLGSLLMTAGLAYDSDTGREYAAAISSVTGASMTELSADVASHKGRFTHWDANLTSGLRVLMQHVKHASKLSDEAEFGKFEVLAAFGADLWREALEKADKYGLRNGQVTVLAPTGTIGFMMDCDTTGVEPETALIKYKTLVGGGTLKIVNRLVPMALKRLGYKGETLQAIVDYVAEHGTVEGCDYIADEDIPVFDTSFPAYGFTRAIDPMGHVRMMAAVQPFLSGAISKTVNLPETATVEDIENVYIAGWKLGLKAIAVYRNNCKLSQPLSTKASEGVAKGEEPALDMQALLDKVNEQAKPRQRKMPARRKAQIHEVTIAGHKLFLTMGLFEDGSLGEVFIEGPKEGSTISGLLRALAITTSLYLQHGAPLDKLVAKLSHMTFEPQGITSNPDLRFTSSLVDYIYRYLGTEFSDVKYLEAPVATLAEIEAIVRDEIVVEENGERKVRVDIPTKFCAACGSPMRPSGSCWACLACGSVSGGCA